MRDIYFVGKAGSGKSSLASYLIEKYNYTLTKMAYPVYNICEKYLGMKNKDRKLLAYSGTDIGRECVDKYIWVDRFIDDIFIAKETAKDLLNKKLVFVCDDVRFKNEHKILKDSGWLGIYLDVSDDIRVARLKERDGDAQVDVLKHKSETSIDDFKNELIKIDASGTLHELYNNLEKLKGEFNE